MVMVMVVVMVVVVMMVVVMGYYHAPHFVKSQLVNCLDTWIVMIVSTFQAGRVGDYQFSPGHGILYHPGRRQMFGACYTNKIPVPSC